MKFIDFVLVFFAFLLCVITKSHINNQLIYDNYRFNEMYNSCIDNIVIDALEAGFCAIDENGNPIVNKDIMIKCFENELSVLLSDTNCLAAIGTNYCILIFVVQDGYYIYQNYLWSDKISFLKTAHDEKVLELEEAIREKYNIELMFASNDGETFKNSIKENSFIAIYSGKTADFDNNEYKIYSISGAMIVDGKIK